MTEDGRVVADAYFITIEQAALAARCSVAAIETWLARYGLRSPVDPGGRGKRRLFSLENVRELAVRAALSRCGVSPRRAARLAYEIITKIPSPTKCAFVDGDTMVFLNADFDVEDAIAEYRELTGLSPDYEPHTVHIIDFAAIYATVERLAARPTLGPTHLKHQAI